MIGNLSARGEKPPFWILSTVCPYKSIGRGTTFKNMSSFRMNLTPPIVSFLPEKSTKTELQIEISKYYLSRASNIFLTSNKLLIK